jgi:hypothetical protein
VTTSTGGHDLLRCSECATVLNGSHCPNCYQRADTGFAPVVGLVVPGSEGPWLVTFGENGDGISAYGITESQAAWATGSN